MQTPSLAAGIAPGLTTSKQELRANILRKNAWHLLPVLTLAFIVNMMDRTSIGFAALTMKQDLGLTASQLGFAAGILFAGYCLFEFPSNLALYRFGDRRWLARIMVTWGIVATATAFVHGHTSLYLLRFLLGVSEAGFFPGVAYLLGEWFPAQYRMRVMVIFTLAVPLSSVITAPISAGLLQLHGLLGFAGWQWLFMLEGVPAILLGFAVLVVLRDRPADAHWLEDHERAELLAMLAEEPRQKPKTALFGSLKDVRVLLLAAIQFGFVMGSYGVGIWLPLILKRHGIATMTIGYLAAVPYVVAVIGMVLWARIVDRTGKNVLSLLIACLMGAIGMAVAALTTNITPVFIGITVAILAVSSARAIFWTIPPRFLTGIAAAGGFAFINSIGTLGGLAGPYMVGIMKDLTGAFAAGLWTMAGMLVVSTLLTGLLWMLMKRQ